MSQKRKILFVITQGEWGGAQRYVFDLATNLGPDYDVTVAVGGDKGPKQLQNALAHHGVSFVQLRHLVRPASVASDIFAIFELAALYKQIRPDVIHLNSSKAGIIGSLARLLYPHKTSLVYTVHGWVFNEPGNKLRSSVFRFLEKITARQKDGIITLSDSELAQAKQLSSHPRILKIANGLAPIEYLTKSDARKKLLANTNLRIPESGRLFGTIANYFGVKALDVLIEAVARTPRLQSETFVLIGDGYERPTLEKLIAKNNLQKNIFLYGAMPDAREFLLAFDYFVLPSRKEGLPYVLLEALRAHVPIIATRVGGIPELIENKKSGLLVNPDNVAELAEALVFAVEHPDEMRRFAENAPTPPPLSEMISQTTSLYSFLLEEPR